MARYRLYARQQIYPDGTQVFNFPRRDKTGAPHTNFVSAVIDWKNKMGIHPCQRLHDSQRRVWVVLPHHDVPPKKCAAWLRQAMLNWDIELLEIAVEHRDKQVDWPEERLS